MAYRDRRAAAAAIIGVCVIVALAAHLPGAPGERPQPSRASLEIGGVSVAVDLASTTAERELGLSGRTSLASGEGMLFLFDEAGLWGFWMKNMNFPIDIIWMDAKGRVITVADSLPPESYPAVFYPQAPARYVLEVPAGFARAHSIGPGSMAVIPSSL